MRYFTFFLFFLVSCKAAIDIDLKNSILKILSENQKIHEQLIQKSDAIPDTTTLLATVKNAKAFSEKSKDILADLEKLESILAGTKTPSQEAFFESISSFSEKLSDILKANEIQTEYNKFYCPMVAKYWVAKGERIQNPFAPEMRECGELVK